MDTEKNEELSASEAMDIDTDPEAVQEESACKMDKKGKKCGRLTKKKKNKKAKGKEAEGSLGSDAVLHYNSDSACVPLSCLPSPKRRK